MRPASPAGPAGAASPDAPGAQALAGVRDRALQAAGIAVVVLDAAPQVPTIVWANESFSRLTGYPASDVVGLSLSVLEAPGGAEFDIAAIRAGMNPAEGETAVTWRMLNARADGGLVWCEFSMAQVPDAAASGTPEADGAPAAGDQHWVCMVTDVSQQVVEHEEQERSIAVERAARNTLDLVSLVSDLLTDLDYPYVLREIAGHLQHGVVGWAGFYLSGPKGLAFSEGISIQATTAATAGSRLTREAGVSVDALGDSRTPGDSIRLGQSATTFIDPLRDLLEGLIAGPINFVVRPDYPAATTASALAAELTTRMGLAPGDLGDLSPGETSDLSPGDTSTGTDEDGPAGGWPVVVVHAVPGRRQVLGALVTTPELASTEGSGRVDATTMTLLHVVARRVGMAIDNVRLYAREHQLAETLQRAMLPEQADIPGLDVWTYYAPTSDHAQVGGDWYDVVQIDEEVAGLVIGDVVGHDIEAAATMGQLRSVVRSYAFELTTPGLVLERVDQLVVGMRIARSASLVYGTLRRLHAGESAVDAAEGDVAQGEVRPGGAAGPEAAGGVETAATPGTATEPDGRWRLEYSRAGHLPPLLVRGGTVTQLSGAAGALIGFGNRARTTSAAVLEPGDALIFYTDGLIERRDRALRAGLAALIDASEHITATDAAGIGEELLARLAEAPEDDVAVVVVRVPDPVADGAAPSMSPRSRRWLLPSEPASIGRARHAVLRTCQAWELADVANAELVVSELVANGVLHGWGHLSLRLFDTGDGLRIEVEDSNPAPPVTTDGHANRLGGYGMQIVERLADWGWRPSGTGKLVWARIRPTVRDAG